MMMNTSSDDEGRESDLSIIVPLSVAVNLREGFAIDAGGSVVKLVYRSKSDYLEAVPITEASRQHGILHLASFKSEAGDADVISYLEKYCDILSPSPDERKDFETTQVFTIHTGIRFNNLERRLWQRFGIRIKLLSEFECVRMGLSSFYLPSLGKDISSNTGKSNFDPNSANSTNNKDKTSGTDNLKDKTQSGSVSYDDQVKTPIIREPGFYPVSLTGLSEALYECREFLKFASGWINYEGCLDKETHMKKLSNSSYEEFREMFEVNEVEFPLIVATLGSALSITLMKDRDTIFYLDCGLMAGRSLLSFARHLLSVEDFDEFIEMASRGNTRHLDVTAAETSPPSRPETDHYTNISSDVPVFVMGKLDGDSQGSYTREDLAAAILSYVCRLSARLVLSSAVEQGNGLVMFSGSLLSRQLVRDCLSKHFYYETLLTPLFNRGKMTKMAIATNPSYVTALGAWQLNSVEIGADKN